jgi:CHAT domain-containing protein/tetratricopeptide (TPR) repeat protein
MQKNLQSSAVVAVCLFFLLCLPLPTASQNNARQTDVATPAELTAVDPEIRALLNYGNSSCKSLDSDKWIENLQRALQIADSRGLVGDRAITGAALASALVNEGKIEMAFLAFQHALQDSMDAKNEVLKADILVSLASEAEMKGNVQQALELVARALKLTQQSESLYEKARALGEFGRLKLLLGKTNEAADPLEEALNIDRLNGYKFEALHLVYKSYYLSLTGQEKQSMESLSQARIKAILTSNAYAFVMAENAYTFGLARKGNTDEAISELELVKKGDLRTFANEGKERDCLTSALGLPVTRLLLLEGISNVLRLANLKDKEIEIWREMFSISQNLGLLAGEAEAEQKIADLENQLNKTDEAVKDYALAASFCRSLQNEAQLNQVEIAESLLLLKLGRGDEAIPLEKEIVLYATSHNLRSLEFIANGVLGEIYQTAGDLSKAREAQERAEALVHPGPYDDEIDNHVVHETYVRLSNIYRSQGIPEKELVSIDKAFFVSVHLKDEKSQQAELAYLDQRLNQLHIRDLVEQKQKEGQLAESLLYSYILFIRDGSPSRPTDDQSNWQRILAIPYQITPQTGGAASLEEILHDIGPMVGFNRSPLLSALARYYITTGADPILAEKYGLELENAMKETHNDAASLKVEPACILAVSYSRQGKSVLAKETIDECTSLAKETGDKQSILYSDSANLLVQAQLGNIAAAKSSLEDLIAKTPDNSELHLELATSLASAKLYDEAGARLDFVVQKLISVGDRKKAASAYATVATVLNADSSEKARQLQLQYLNSARQLYHEIGAQPEEAELLVALGDYYLKLAKTKSAIDNYAAAFELAQKTGRRDIVAESLLGLGNVYKIQRDFNRAVENHLKAAEAYHKLNNPTREAVSLGELASDYFAMGDADRSLSSLVEAKNVSKNAPAFNKYLVAYLLGDFYRSQGQFEKALTAFTEAVEITKQAGDLEHLGYSHWSIAVLNTIIGNWDDALSESQIALELFQKIENRDGQAACWALLTGIYSGRSSSLRNFDKAQECYAKAQEFGFGKALELDLMEIYVQSGKYSEAAKIASESLQDCQKRQNTDCQANALISLSEAERLAGDLRDSRSALNKARPLASKSPEIYLRGRLLYGESRLLVSESKLDEALVTYKQLIALIESIKGHLSAQEQRSIAENYGYIYDELVSLLYSMSKRTPCSQLKFASDSLDYAEVNKARQFAESWGRVFVNQMRMTLPPTTQEHEQALYSRRDRILTQLETNLKSSGPNEKSEAEHLEADLSSVQREIKIFINSLRETAPQYAAIAYPEKIQLSTLPLRTGETLVEFKMTDASTYVWIIQNQDGKTNDLAAFYEIPRKRAWFLDQLSLLRQGLNSGRPGALDWKISEGVFAALFPGQIGKMLADSQEIIFVPDDVLFVLPLELFSPEASKGNFIFLKKATTYYPSAASFRLARTASHQSNWREGFLGLADPITSPEDERFEVAGALNPVVQGASNQRTEEEVKRSPNPERLKVRGFSFERLPGTAVEVQSIASLLKARNETVDVRSGASATKSALLDTDLSNFRFVHFATHGVLPVDTGIKEPSLVLSYDGIDPSHMFLSMSEILGLKLRSESVVLSACNTGSGKISRAEGVMSLGRAFLAAGASSVTVSLWQVSDESTALLMEKYYGGLLNARKKSDALALARSAVYESGAKDPLFWAPFIVIGE